MDVNEIRRAVLRCLADRRYDEADRLTRMVAREVYQREICRLPEGELFALIDRITGGLGYFKGDFNVMRMSYVGALITWPEAIPEGGKVLEIGTGLGRTCYAAVNWARPSLYVSLDISPEMLAIALHRNPVPAYREALNAPCVRLCLCDAVEAVRVLREAFDHIIHDGGPNPRKNPRLFDEGFIRALVGLLKPGGTISIFAGRDRRWQDRIFRALRALGLEARSVSFPDSPTLVIRARKR